MSLSSDLRDLALHLEAKAELSEAYAKDCSNNNEQARAQQHLKRAANARKYVDVCRRAAEQLAEKKARKKEATLAVSDQPEFQALVKLFGRTARSVWSEGEIKKYTSLKAAGMLTPENLNLLAYYYVLERNKGEEGRHRRDLGTFLNNLTGELDRAREAVAPKATAQAEPPEWAAFLSNQPREIGRPAYQHAPGFMKTAFEKWRKGR